MFDRLKTFFKGKEFPTPTAATGKFAPAAPVKVDEKYQSEKGKTADKKASKSAAKTPAKKPPTAEELCGVTSKMGKDEVRQKLALLYRRYNRATSSLDSKLRSEAEVMLDAIVAVREKVIGPI
jgi:hypothetical protein